MAASLLPPKSIQKRKSLRDRLDRIDALGDESAFLERFNLMEELDNDLEQAHDFRWHASKTQSQQDFHLDLFRAFILKWLKGHNTDSIDAMTEDEKIALLFPDDEKLHSYQLSMFIIHVFKNTAPRSRAANTIHIRSLVKYRNSMLFWTGWYYDKRGKQWGRRKLYNDMTRAMRYVQQAYGEPLVKPDKTWLGLAELRQLLDFEAMNNLSIELSEEHQLLWCVGRVTALRPGSLCPSGKYARTEPLTWRCLEFTQGDVAGRFSVRMTVDRIDIKHPEASTDDMQPVLENKLSINMPSPTAENLVFSPSHRLLVIALRRGLLQDISSIDELLAYTGHVIPISPEHLDDTIFYSGQPKGDGLDFTKSLRAPALTDYLRRRGRQIGYTSSISWYSIRRRAATDMAMRIGTSATRLFLGHTPDSQVLERYYLNMTETLDQSGILLDEPIESGGHSSEKYKNWAPLALDRLKHTAFQQTRGNALAQLTQRIILADPDPPQNLSAQSIKNYRRNARRIAEQQLIAVEAEKQRTSISKADMDQRRAALRASHFADEVLQRALEATETHGIGNAFAGQLNPELEDANDEDGSNFVRVEGASGAQAADQEAEEDLEQVMARLGQDVQTDASGAIVARIDDDDQYVDIDNAQRTPIKQVSYDMLAKTMMELLMDNTLSAHTKWSGADKTCPVCREDDTVSEEQRMHQYKLKAHLDSHMNGNFHHPVSKWKRRVAIESRRDNGRYDCPYCEESDLSDEKGYKRMNHLIQHIMESSQLSTSKKHDELKAADGWYDEDFQYADNLPASSESVAKHMARGVKSLAEIGIDLSPQRQLLVPEPYEKSDSIVRGSHPAAPPSARYTPFMQAGAVEVPPAEDAIPHHLKDYIGTGYMTTPTNPLPPYMRGVVEVTRMPRSQEDDDGDQEMSG